MCCILSISQLLFLNKHFIIRFDQNINSVLFRFTAKAFDITYVRLKFHTSRPESFAIYKKKCHNCDWQPFQYYSGSCFSTFNIDNKVSKQ